MKKFALAVIAASALSGCVVAPTTPIAQEHFFMKEKHRIAAKCGWLDDLVIVTGETPMIFNPNTKEFFNVDKTEYKKGKYLVSFNKNSLLFAYEVNNQRAAIIDSSSTTLCNYAFLSE